MKKIVILLNNVYKCGGVQKVVSIMANKLIKTQKYNLTILSMFKTNSMPFFEFNKDIKVCNIYEQPFDLRFGHFKMVEGLKKYLQKNNVDIIIGAGIGYSSIIYLASKHNKYIKTIGWEHQNYFFGKKFGLEWIGKRVSCAKLDSVVVLTKYDYNSYMNNMKNINRIEQIYNPIEEVEKSYEYNPDTKKIISCGSLVPQKGFDIAVEVARKVFKKHPDWQWHIFGDGYDREMLEGKIKEYSLQDNFILRGYCNNVDEQYVNYSIYVMTSRHEGFPMVLIEAQANKLPIVSFNCKCGPNEIVKNEVNGYLVDCFDVNSLTERLCDLIENRNKRIGFSHNTSLNNEKLDINTTMKQWEILFDTI